MSAGRARTLGALVHLRQRRDRAGEPALQDSRRAARLGEGPRPPLDAFPAEIALSAIQGGLPFLARAFGGLAR